MKFDVFHTGLWANFSSVSNGLRRLSTKFFPTASYTEKDIFYSSLKRNIPARLKYMKGT